MIFNDLSELDKEKIEYYIDTWVGKYASVDPAPLSEILYTWSYSKRNLYEKFGRNFILKRPVDIHMTSHEKLTRMDNELHKRVFRDFIVAFIDKVSSFDFEYEISSGLRSLVQSSNLSSNTYKGENFYFINPVNNKKVQVQNGASIMKILGKLARDWGLEEEFEVFRNAHSHVIENNHLKGNLCLSIHPLDFMTMSDNDCGWNSCMSWTTDKGTSKQGTVEMMNSRNVVVAYLETSKPFYLNPGDRENCPYTWSNKAWRKLYIVDDDFITGIKDYPFKSSMLDDMVMKWLRELCGNENYTDSTYNIIPDEENIINGDTEFFIEFECGHMYNDFYNNNPFVPMYLSKKLIESAVPTRIQKKKLFSFGKQNYEKIPTKRIDHLYYDYSGACQCMWCGGNLVAESDQDLDWEIFDGALICSDCADACRCSRCSDRVIPGEETYFKGEVLCPWCANIFIRVDDITGEEDFSSDMELVSVRSIDNPDEISIVNILTTTYDDYDIWDKYLIEDYQYGVRYDGTTSFEYYVFFEELNEKGKELFGVNDVSDLYKKKKN